MRILIVSLDTRGGVEPYGALALGLSLSGHSVTVAAPEDLAHTVIPVGLNVIALPGSSRVAVELLGSTERVVAAPLALRQQLRENVGIAVTATLGSAESPDLVLAGVGGRVVAETVAAATGARFLAAHLQPVGPPTSLYPAVMAPAALRSPGLPRWLGHQASAQFVKLPTAGLRGAARAAAGLPLRAEPRRIPGAIYGYSEHVVPHPPTWPASHVITGYWRSPVQAEPLEPSLAGFLDGGTPPVVAGFGSMRTGNPESVRSAVIEASLRLGLRVVILTGWDAPVSRGDLPPTVFLTEHAPHETLYARASIALHHGGAGTTAASLIAGLPTVTVPFSADQPFWGGRVRDLGVGPAPVPIKDVSTHSLEKALEFADRPGTRERSRQLAELLAADNGVKSAVDAINRLAGG